jgi:hypothetical protein
MLARATGLSFNIGKHDEFAGYDYVGQGVTIATLSLAMIVFGVPLGSPAAEAGDPSARRFISHLRDPAL